METQLSTNHDALFLYDSFVSTAGVKRNFFHFINMLVAFHIAFCRMLLSDQSLAVTQQKVVSLISVGNLLKFDKLKTE